MPGCSGARAALGFLSTHVEYTAQFAVPFTLDEDAFVQRQANKV